MKFNISVCEGWLLGVSLTVVKAAHMAGKALLMLYASVGTKAVLNGISGWFTLDSNDWKVLGTSGMPSLVDYEEDLPSVWSTHLFEAQIT